jgi:pimeloyl-ACP methyl ester carboxylesterase/predicted lipid carrier protein YhbT
VPGIASGHAIEAALRARIARRDGRVEKPGAKRDGRIVFDAGVGVTWTVDLRKGKASLSRGRGRDATSTITSDATTLLAVLDGSLPGVEAFLTGRLYMRGNIALTLELDDMLPPPTRDPRSPRCHTAVALGVRSFYLEAGRVGAPQVVLLHGLGATSASFLPMIWDLARDHHVFALDLPGFGESDKPVRALHPEYFARWLAAWLDVVGLERPHVVGNSMGGRVALEIGLRSPSKVDRLVLLAPSLAWRRYRAAAWLVRLLRPELAVMPLRVLHRMVILSLHTMFARPERVADAAMNAAADEFVRIFATPRGRIAFFHAAREIYLEDPHGTRGFWDRLPALSRPSLFVFGDKDRLVPHAFLRHVRSALPSAECEVLSDCGHVAQFELPELTNGLVRAFLAR